MKKTSKQKSVFILLAITIMIISLIMLNNNLLKINAQDIMETQMTETTEDEELSDIIKVEEQQKSIKAISKNNIKGITNKEYAIAANGVKVPLDALITDFDTIEDFPFAALDEPGELVGYTRATINEPIEFPTKMKDGRTYNFMFGALSNSRKISDKIPKAFGGVNDLAYIKLPRKEMPTSEIKNVWGDKVRPTDVPNPLEYGIVPLLGSHVAIAPSGLNREWAVSVFYQGNGAGTMQTGFAVALGDAVNAVRANNGEFPQLLIMYVKDDTVLAYGVSYNSKTQAIDGYMRVKLAPKGVKGRVTTDITYLNALSQENQMALAYGIHVDINKAHEDSKLFSLGDGKGLYFQQNKISDGLPYLLKYHVDGYEHQPDAYFAHDKWGLDIWGKVFNSHTSQSVAEVGQDNAFPNTYHPAVAMRWNPKKLQPSEIYTARFEQSITTANAYPPTLTKTVKNLTTLNNSNNNVDDFLEYSIEIKAKTAVFDLELEDILPEGLAKPEYIKLDTYVTGETMKTQDLVIDDIYTENTRKIDYKINEIRPDKVTLRYKVKVLPEASDKLLTNMVKLNGIDFDDDPLEELESSVDVKVKEIPYGFALIKYLDEDKVPLKKEVTLQGKIGLPIEPDILEIPGYLLATVEPPEALKYKVGTQTITYTYKEGRYTLEQDVFNSEGTSVAGKTVKNKQELTYKVILKSLFKPVTPAVSNYKTVIIKEKIGEYLENIEEITFLTVDSTVAGTGTYDPVTKEVKTTLTNLSIDRSENLILTFKATVKKDALAETEIKVKALAEASYSDDMTAKEVTSNEVISKVLGGLTLVSAPDGVNFGSVNVSDYQKEVAVDKNDMQTPLLVQDTRIKRTNWDVTAQIISDMTNGSDVRTGALKYYYNKKPLTLNNLPQPIYDNDGKNTTFEFNISNLWGKVAEAEGLKLDMSGGEAPSATNSYNGTIQWTVRDVIE